MVDYYAVLPWLGVALAGIYIGHTLYANSVSRLTLPDKSNTPLIRELAFLGQHSLLNYLVHQPFFNMRAMGKIAASVRGVALLKVVVGLGAQAQNKAALGVAGQIPGQLGQNGRAAGKGQGNASAQDQSATVLGGQNQRQERVVSGFGCPEAVKADFCGATSEGRNFTEIAGKQRGVNLHSGKLGKQVGDGPVPLRLTPGRNAVLGHKGGVGRPDRVRILLQLEAGFGSVDNAQVFLAGVLGQ